MIDMNTAEYVPSARDKVSEESNGWKEYVESIERDAPKHWNSRNNLVHILPSILDTTITYNIIVNHAIQSKFIYSIIIDLVTIMF